MIVLAFEPITRWLLCIWDLDQHSFGTKILICFEIRGFFDPWIRNPGWKKPTSGIRDEHPGTYILELSISFWVKILKFFDADADAESFQS